MLHVVVFPEGEYLVAQCLEHDIAVHARSMSDLKFRFYMVLVDHVLTDIEAGREPLDRVPKAPQMFWDRFASASEPVPVEQPEFVNGTIPVAAQPELEMAIV